MPGGMGLPLWWLIVVMAGRQSPEQLGSQTAAPVFWDAAVTILSFSHLKQRLRFMIV